ncbi:MAG: TlpA family protein disulfide reductase [Acidobacteria bacterium]|nr:TlpA family protein disulfide reductase [Acidobacteriota bacterium]
MMVVPAIVVCASLPAQQTAFSPTAEELLQQAATMYAHADNFHTEMSKEQTDSAPRWRNWRKLDMSVIRSSPNRFRIESHAGTGSWIQMSDGKTEWTYWIDGARYEEHPLIGAIPHFLHAVMADDQYLREAWSIATNLEQLARTTINLERFPDETITVGTQRIPCFVVHGQMKKRNDEFTSDRTLWIDKRTHVFRKIIERNKNSLINGDVHSPFNQEIIRLFPVFDLNPVSPDAAFSFVPLNGVKKVNTLEPEWARHATAAIQSSPPHRAPDIDLIAEDGSRHKLSEYLGKPVLIDMWATWCAPCLSAMPDFSRLAAKYKATDLIVLSIDEDLRQSAAIEYLHSHNFLWTNLHDQKRTMQIALAAQGIPMTLVMDRNGQIIFQNISAGDNYETLIAALDRAISLTTSTH